MPEVGELQESVLKPNDFEGSEHVQLIRSEVVEMTADDDTSLAPRHHPGDKSAVELRRHSRANSDKPQQWNDLLERDIDGHHPTHRETAHDNSRRIDWISFDDLLVGTSDEVAALLQLSMPGIPIPTALGRLRKQANVMIDEEVGNEVGLQRFFTAEGTVENDQERVGACGIIACRQDNVIVFPDNSSLR